MRPLAILIATLTLAGCRGQAPAPQPQPMPVASGTLITAVPIDTSGQPRGLPAVSDSLLLRSMLRADTAGSLVDTIVTLADSLVLHVGQTLHFVPNELVQGRRADGSPVARFAPMVSVEDSRVAQFVRGGLTGVHEGATRLVVRPMSFDPTLRSHASPAHIRVVVQP